MTFWEFIYSLLGGGTLVGMLSAFLLFINNKKGHDIDWYDRAIVQVKELDAQIVTLEAIIKELNGNLQHEREEKEKLQSVLKKMENTIIVLKNELDDFKKKGSNKNEKN